MKRVATASLCLAFALLTFLQFPGHTWLQQDTQIYTPILENLRDPSLFRNEIIVQQPHVAWSLYDERAGAAGHHRPGLSRSARRSANRNSRTWCVGSAHARRISWPELGRGSRGS